MKEVFLFKAKDGTEVKVRYPKFSDWKDLMKLINSAVEEGAFIKADRKFNSKEEKKWLREVLKKIKEKKAVMLVAEVNGKVVGNCSINKGKYSKSHVGTLGILIKKEFRGLGIGKRLMQLAIEEARKKLKIEIVVLTLFSVNKIAHHLYRKLGFKEFGVLRKGLKRKGKYFDEIYMVKYLK